MDLPQPALLRTISTNSLRPDVATKKRFIICCDGTWNSSDSGLESIPSNVALLSRMIARRGTIGGDSKKPIEQVVYYQTGVGTGPTAGMAAKLESAFEGATGSGLEEHVVQAYHFIATNYEEGDEVLLFGFSRGAYTARALGGLLTQMGLLQPVDLKYFNQIYRCFKEQGDQINYTRCVYDGKTAKIDDEQLEAEKKNREAETKRIDAEWNEALKADPKAKREVLFHNCVHEKKFDDIAEKMKAFPKWTLCVGPNKVTPTTWDAVKAKAGYPNPEPEPIVLSKKPPKITLEVIGVWDTVGALGIPESYLSYVTGINKGADFANTQLNKNVRRAYQALALDEHRGAFTPSLWYLKDDPKFAKNGPTGPSGDPLGLAVDLRQCWFPGFHCDVGGGTEMDKTFVKDELAHNIDQISLAWMCDQVEGLVTFHEDVAYAFLPGPSIEHWTAKMSPDPMKAYYWVNFGGGSRYRTPGMYNRADLETVCGPNGEPVSTMEEGDVDQHTRERIHPSVQMLIDATSIEKNKHLSKEHRPRPYQPVALSTQYSMYGKGYAVIAPGWEFKENPAGTGAKWIRPHVKPTPAGRIYKATKGTREVSLDEHVIIDRGPGFHNFEARLLTNMAKDMLDARNKTLIERVKSSLDKTDALRIAGYDTSQVLQVPGCHDDWWFKHDQAHKHAAINEKKFKA